MSSIKLESGADFAPGSQLRLEDADTPEVESIDGDLGDDDAAEPELYEHFHFEADAGQQLLRVDRFLTERIPKASRNRVQQAAAAGCVLANGKQVKSNYRVKPHDIVTVVMDRPRYDFEITPEPIELDVVYEDDTLLVVNKPAGLVVHPGSGHRNGTLVNALAWHLRDNPNYDVNDPRLGLVHRIDKDTSGLLVVAKTPDAKTHLSSQFYNHTTRREYNALVWGIPDPPMGTVATNIARSPKDRLIMAPFPLDGEVGKRAITHYEVIEPLQYCSLMRCHLETGRTHQIRVHMSHIGHPLFNDAHYGGDKVLRGVRSATYNRFIDNCFELCPRQALHARTLGFVHPVTSKEMFFTAPLPEDMEQLLEKWRRLS